MKSSYKKLIKWMVLMYIACTSLIGTAIIGVVVFYPVFVMGYNHFSPAPMPVLLSNGFYWNADGSIADKNRQKVIFSKVKNIMWYEDWVYGYRKGPAYEKYYFICKHGDDCSDTQHYNDVEFKKLSKGYGLPDFDGEIMKDYSKLLWEQRAKGIDTGYGG